MLVRRTLLLKWLGLMFFCLVAAPAPAGLVSPDWQPPGQLFQLGTPMGMGLFAVPASVEDLVLGSGRLIGGQTALYSSSTWGGADDAAPYAEGWELGYQPVHSSGFEAVGPPPGEGFWFDEVASGEDIIEVPAGSSLATVKPLSVVDSAANLPRLAGKPATTGEPRGRDQAPASPSHRAAPGRALLTSAKGIPQPAWFALLALGVSAAMHRR